MIRIFYVEDEPFLAKIVKESLESRDFQVVHFADGMKANKSYQVNEFDICLLDVMLPNTNGFEIAKSIRKVDPDTPIIFLTAKDQTDDVVKGFESGGNDYVRKPFSMEELIVRIDNLLKIKGAKDEAIKKEIVLGDKFVYHPSKYKLTFGDEEQKLSHKEVAILNILCNNLNKVSLRKEILMQGWGDDSYFNSRNLDVYIRKIRGYFSKDPDIKIVTLKSVGYQFVIE